MLVLKQHTQAIFNPETNKLQAQREAQPLSKTPAGVFICMLYICAAKCEVMKQVGGIFMYVLGFVKLE